MSEWYSNKQLFEMLNELKDQMAKLSRQMERTETILRDYNGVRETINEHSRKIQALEATNRTRKDYTGWIIAGIMCLITVLNYLKG